MDLRTVLSNFIQVRFFSSLSFVTYFHFCFNVALQNEVDECGSLWMVMRRIKLFLICGYGSSESVCVPDVLTEVGRPEICPGVMPSA